jgi:hypothetical protein
VTESAIPRQGGFVFDERRNTSRVWPVPPEALDQARHAFNRIDPTLRRWLLDGHPTLTEAEHVERFGAAYDTTRPGRGKAKP